MSDILQVEGINSKGFGIIPKLVMQDRRLTTEAKAIYGYFASYAGAGKTAFPNRDKIIRDLGMSVNRYYNHFKLLKQFGYVSVERQPPVKGILQRNIYTLLEIVPCIQNRDMENHVFIILTWIVLARITETLIITVLKLTVLKITVSLVSRGQTDVTFHKR